MRVVSAPEGLFLEMTGEVVKLHLVVQGWQLLDLSHEAYHRDRLEDAVPRRLLRAFQSIS
jgi:hypothetical protein